MDYLVRFNAHIIESKRPSGFPAVVYHDMFVRADSDAQLKQATNDQCMLFIRQQGIVVPKDPNRKVDEAFLKYDTRLFVPIGMVAYISTETKPMDAPIPDSEDEIHLQ